MANYEVIVGNIGSVYQGKSPILARQTYGEYRLLSMSGYGRSAQEDVTLMKDGEPELEFVYTAPRVGDQLRQLIETDRELCQQLKKSKADKPDVSQRLLRNYQAIVALVLKNAGLFAKAEDMQAAAMAALEHVRELRDAWQRGSIRELDTMSGERSNRNVEVEILLRDAIKSEP